MRCNRFIGEALDRT